MRLPRILNQCHPIPGFVYGQASFAEDGQTVLIPVRPRKRSTAICSGCHQPAPGYDQSPTPRRFEFIGFWGYLVFLVYCMRRVNCKQCGVVVEEVPWGMGKHTSTKVHMHFLGHWARKLSWKETAEEFRTSWDKVHDAVAYLVAWGLEHRVLGAIRAIGVDEIQYGKGHKYLTLGLSDRPGLYPAAVDWQGTDRENLQGILCHDRPGGVGEDRVRLLGHVETLSGGDPREMFPGPNILDRFHIVAKVNKALDDIRSAEARRLRTKLATGLAFELSRGTSLAPLPRTQGIISPYRANGAQVPAARPRNSKTHGQQTLLPTEPTLGRRAKTVPKRFVGRVLEDTVEREADSPS